MDQKQAKTLPVDLTGLRVLPGNAPAERLAGEIFSSALASRGLHESAAGAAVSFCLDASVPDDDRFVVERAQDALTVRAKSVRGLLFGAGLILRKTETRGGRLLLTREIAGTHAPYHPIRGHQLGYRPLPNTYDAWSPAQYRRYFLDIMFFGANTMEHVVLADLPENRNALMRLPQETLLAETSRTADALDLNVSLWYPNETDESDADGLAARERVFRAMKRIDRYFPPGGDPGGLEAEEFLRRTALYGAALKKTHPNARVCPSQQSPTGPGPWGEAFLQYLAAHPESADGVIHGPNWAFELHELRRRLPAGFAVTLYPDITHNLRCESPVRFDREDWHYAFQACLSRESVNPRPVELQRLHRLQSPYTNGSVTYSEGVHDDVNKAVWCALEWDPDASVREILSDYARLYLPGADPALAAEAILGLEQNWLGDPALTTSVPDTLDKLRRLAVETPSLSENWRYLLLLFRGVCDQYIRLRRLADLDAIENARAAILAGDPAGAADALAITYSGECAALRAELDALADQLFALIGIQLSVEKHGAYGWERGAVLDTIDRPVSDRLWLLDRLKTLGAARAKRLFTRREKGVFRFSFALDDLSALGLAQTPYAYRNIQADRPQYAGGNLPMRLANVYDHYTLRFRAGGLTAAGGYQLRLETLPDGGEGRLTIRAGDAVVWDGARYGGRTDPDYDALYGAPGFESRVYDLPPGCIENGCVTIDIAEPVRGVRVAALAVEPKQKI